MYKLCSLILNGGKSTLILNASSLVSEPEPKPPCKSYEWQCTGKDTCIPAEKVCDGVSTDCPGGEDEGDLRCGKYILAHRKRISEILPWNRKSYFTHAILPRTSSNIIM